MRSPPLWRAGLPGRTASPADRPSNGRPKCSRARRSRTTAGPQPRTCGQCERAGAALACAAVVARRVGPSEDIAWRACSLRGVPLRRGRSSARGRSGARPGRNRAWTRTRNLLRRRRRRLVCWSPIGIGIDRAFVSGRGRCWRGRRSRASCRDSARCGHLRPTGEPRGATMGAQSGCMWSSFLQALRRIEGSRSRFSQAAREAPRPKRRSPGTGNQVS